MNTRKGLTPKSYYEGLDGLKILVVTDIHDRVRYVKKLKGIDRDITIVVGDITYFKSGDYALKILKLLENSKPLLFVPGNCDDYNLLQFKRVNKITNIHGDVAEYDTNGLAFIGLGGSNITPFNTLIEFSEEEIWDILLGALSKVRSKTIKLVIVSHVPPHNTVVDLTHSGEHAGSTSVRRFIEEYEPILCICGHIHEARGMDRIGNTIVVNPGPLMYKYYALIDISSSRVEVKLCKL